MANDLVNKSIILCVALSMILTGFIVMGTGNVKALPATPTINPPVPDIIMDQDSEYYYDLSHHESDDNDVPVPPLISVIIWDARAYYIQCNGVGGFSALTYLGDTGSGARATCVGDFDNDGDYDILTTHSNNAWYFWLYYYENTGTPTMASFGGPQFIGQYGDNTYQTGNYANGMAPADYDNDGNLDFVINTNSCSSWLFLGDGNFGFNHLPLPRMDGNNGRGADAGDIDGDGDEDLVMADIPGNVYLYTNTDGDFTKTNLGDHGSDIYGSVLADFNNDGNLDILFEEGSLGDTHLALGNGDGTFGAFNYVASADQNHHSCFDAYDFNDDGNQDIVLVDYDWDQVWFYPGNGDGTFAARQFLGNTPNIANGVLGIGTPHKTIGAAGLTWSVSDIDTGLIDSITIDAATDRMTIVSQPGVWGSDEVELTLTNTLLESTSQWITITIPEPYDDAVIAPPIPDQTLYRPMNKLDLSVYEANNFVNEIILSTPTTVSNYQVKVVLNPGNFDYSLAKMNGADLRFFDTNGNPLSYWIESWNYGDISTIWVKLPNVGTERFNMKYGNPYATPMSDLDSVMDTGLRYFYYDGRDLTGLLGSGVDTNLNHNWGTGTATIEGNPWENQWDYFSIAWEGWVIPFEGGSHNFNIRTDDGARLTVDDVTIWDDWWSLHGENNAWAAYSFYEPVQIWFGFEENGGGAVARLGWDPAGPIGSTMPVPSSQLRCRKYMATEPTTYVGPGASYLTWSVSDVDTSLFTANMVDFPNDILHLNPVDLAGGSDDILLTLTDSQGHSDTQWITVTVPPYGVWIAPPVPNHLLDNPVEIVDLSQYEKDTNHYQKTISLSPITPLNNYQVKVVLNTGNFDYSHANSDGGDVRFFDLNDNPLDYFIDFWVVGGTSIIWVMVPDAGTSQFIMEYGDPRMVDASDGEATFPTFFDGFDDGVIDTTKWPTQSLGPYFYETNGCLEVDRSNPSYYIQSPAFSSLDLPIIIEAKTQTNSVPPNGWSPIMWYQNSNEGASLLDHGGGSHYVRNDGGWILPASSRPFWDWHINRLTLPGTGTWIASGTFGTETWANWQSSYGNSFSGNYYLKIGPRHDGNNYDQYVDGRVDWVRIRTYFPTEPVASLGPESGTDILTWSVSDVDTAVLNAQIVDVPNDILLLTWPTSGIGGSDNILLTLTSSNGYSVSQWVTVTVPDYPEIDTTVPINGAILFKVDGAVIVIFDQPMNLATVTFTCTPDPGGWDIVGDQTTMVFMHDDFAPDTTYTFTITGGTGMNGLPLVPTDIPNPWTFTTNSGEEVVDEATSSPGSGSLLSLDSQWTMLIGMAGIGIFFLFFLFIIGRRRKDDEEDEELGKENLDEFDSDDNFDEV